MAIESSSNLCTLPENCIANALSFTSPKDVGRLSLVTSTFRSASLADAVWERFLPSDYPDIISRAVDPDSLLGRFRYKRDLFLHLSDHPILIDDGRKSFWLEKLSGKKCLMLAPRDLSIEWFNRPELWEWTSDPKSRFAEVAMIGDAPYLNVRAKIYTDMLSPGTVYAVYFVFSNSIPYRPFKERVVSSVSITGHQIQRPRSIFFCGGIDGYPVSPFTKLRDDRWKEIELGECFVRGGQPQDDAHFEAIVIEFVSVLLRQSGMVIGGVEIRPKDDADDAN